MPRKYALLAALGLIFVGVQLAHYLHILDELLPHQTHADDRRPIVSRHHPALENDSDAPHRTRKPYTQTQGVFPSARKYSAIDYKSGSWSSLDPASSTTDDPSYKEARSEDSDGLSANWEQEEENGSQDKREVESYVSMWEAYEAHKFAGLNQSYESFLDGYRGSIVMNQKSVKIGEQVMNPFEQRSSSRLAQRMQLIPEITPTIHQLFPAMDPMHAARFNSCAVVGSAGLLLIREFGPEIDAHDAVFRFNLAPVRKFEAFVGNKTTIRLINRKHFGFRETADEMILQHVTTKEVMKEYLEYRRLHPGVHNFAVDMKFYKWITSHKDSSANHRPTNGFFGLHLAIMLCRQINIYGFLRNWKGWVKYHYFNPEEPNEQQLHRDTSGEMPLIEALLKVNAGRMHFAHPCVIDSKCDGCMAGAVCSGEAPFPAPRAGYCRRPGTQCFSKCPVSVACPGGEEEEEEEGKKKKAAKKKRADCPAEWLEDEAFQCVDSHRSLAPLDPPLNREIANAIFEGATGGERQFATGRGLA